MLRPLHVSDVVKTAGFRLHHYLGSKFRIRFSYVCYILAILPAGLFLIGSAIDGSLVLPGRNIGLLEHPGIWVFLILQVALPISLKYSLKKLIRSGSRLRELAKTSDRFSQLVVVPLEKFLQLEDRESRLAATLIYGAGLVAFVWNTYQNSQPGVIVPYDFWDSKNFFFGFWLTRVYKLYLFVWLLPYIGLVHVAVLVVVLRIIRQARVSGRLKLIPFHHDGVTGLGFVPGLVTTPIIVTVLVSSFSTAAAFEVHRAADVTPIMGLVVIILATAIGYIIPIIVLRSDILVLKRDAIAKLRRLQQAYYSNIVDSSNIDFEKVRNGNEALDYFEKVCARIHAISNYPHLKRLIGYMTLALTPSIATLIIKSLLDVVPMIRPFLGHP
jgi:hypothetical protein